MGLAVFQGESQGVYLFNPHEFTLPSVVLPHYRSDKLGLGVSLSGV